uniref:Uncharacterized protein n=1 Tax=Cacopsylla melanoneura TaxID=428564 RepID=A0A8D8X7K6_9HEMI
MKNINVPMYYLSLSYYLNSAVQQDVNIKFIYTDFYNQSSTLCNVLTLLLGCDSPNRVCYIFLVSKSVISMYVYMFYSIIRFLARTEPYRHLNYVIPSYSSLTQLAPPFIPSSPPSHLSPLAPPFIPPSTLSHLSPHAPPLIPSSPPFRISPLTPSINMDLVSQFCHRCLHSYLIIVLTPLL